MHTPDLCAPVRLGALEAPNRIVMAPLTRRRAGLGRVPTPLMAEYYAQRAAAGLIVSEATAISQQGTGCPNSPGIYTDDQITGWQRVTEAVHLAGGRIFLQLWHMGRISHPSFQPSLKQPIGLAAFDMGDDRAQTAITGQRSKPRQTRISLCRKLRAEKSG
ncbi:MAG: hypothetical protein HY299_16670 [Verrucomicrobia bacterium]|nr:hypothetical protein [Verrucomicrobiota bacterium]